MVLAIPNGTHGVQLFFTMDLKNSKDEQMALYWKGFYIETW